MAVRRMLKSHDRGLSVCAIGCAPAFSVTYSAAAAAVAVCGAIISVMPLPFSTLFRTIECTTLFNHRYGQAFFAESQNWC